MKKGVVVILCIVYISLHSASAYSKELNPQQSIKGSDKKLSVATWYLSPGLFLGVNAKMGTCLAATVILSNNWGLGVSIKNARFTAKNLPATYYGGMQLFGDDTPHDRLEYNSLLLIRQFVMENPCMRFGIEAGPAWVRSITKDFKPSGSSSRSLLDFGPNYETSNAYKENIALSFRAKMETPLTRVISVEFAVFGNVNSIKSIAGMEVCLNFGKIRNKKIRSVIYDSNAE